MNKVNVAALLLGFLLLFSCKTEEVTTADSKEEVNTVGANEEQKVIVKNMESNPTISLPTGAIIKIGSGSAISEMVEAGKLETGDVVSIEGYDFKTWNMLDANLGKIGYVMEHPDFEGEIGNIYITSPKLKIGKDIAIGNTWKDLKEAYPDMNLFRGENGNVVASMGRTAYQLNAPANSRTVKASEVDQTALIEKIWISHHVDG